MFETEWQSFRTKKNRRLELTSAFHKTDKKRIKVAVKVVDIFGNDTMTVVYVSLKRYPRGIIEASVTKPIEMRGGS